MSAVPDIDISPQHWAIVESILQRLVPTHEVWAFGSRAQKTAKRYSDLDLCVLSERTLGLSLRSELAEAFSESDLPWKVDVVDWATTNEIFRQIIRGHKVVLQKGSDVSRLSGDNDASGRTP